MLLFCLNVIYCFAVDYTFVNLSLRTSFSDFKLYTNSLPQEINELWTVHTLTFVIELQKYKQEKHN